MPTDINTIQAWASIATFIVTALTGFFIVQTFILHAKATVDQSEIVRIEQSNFRLKFFPRLHQRDFQRHPIYFGGRAHEVVQIEVLDHEIIKINYIKYDSHPRMEIDEHYYDKTLILGVKFYLTWTFSFDTSDLASSLVTSDNTFVVKVTIEFLDLLGNIYQQTFVYKPNEGAFLQPAIYLGTYL